MKKLETEMTGLENLVGKMNNLLESIRVTVAEERISQLEYELYTGEEIGKYS